MTCLIYICENKRKEDGFMLKYKTGRQPAYPRLIISFTSYPGRIHTVHKTAESLLHQSMKPDRLILWLASDQFPKHEQELPKELLELRKFGLTISWCEDLKSYKKLIPALKKYPNDIIVTADDDAYYPYDWLKLLYASYQQEKELMIHCHRITKFYKEDGEWHTIPEGRSVYPEPSYLHKLVGLGGVLYPPNSLHPDVLDEEKFQKLAPTNDDIWFWLMAVLYHVKIKMIRGAVPCPNLVEGSQEHGALSQTNDMGPRRFWVDFKAVIKEYPQLEEILCDEYQLMEQLEKKESSLNLFFQPLRMRKMLYKLPVVKQIHKLHLLIDELKSENDECKRHMMQLKEESISKREFHQTIQKVRREIQYNFFRGLPEEKYKEAICDWYYFQTGKRLNIDAPKTFNEKIQWLKLYDSTPLKTKLADKVAVREWVSRKIGRQYLIPCFGVWNSFEEIDFDLLPEQFVLKTNHGCGWNVIVKNRRDFDKEDAGKKFGEWMGTNYAWYGLEPHYKNIPPKIYAEKYLENEGELYDYKFLCFHGKVQYVWVITDRDTKMRLTIFDSEWNKQNFSAGWPQSEADIPKPDFFNEMKLTAQKLSEGFPFVRVDLYNVEGKIYFGEMTFTSGNGKYQFEPEEYDVILGEMIHLPWRGKEHGQDRSFDSVL